MVVTEVEGRSETHAEEEFAVSVCIYHIGCMRVIFYFIIGGFVDDLLLPVVVVSVVESEAHACSQFQGVSPASNHIVDPDGKGPGACGAVGCEESVILTVSEAESGAPSPACLVVEALFVSDAAYDRWSANLKIDVSGCGQAVAVPGRVRMKAEEAEKEKNK